MCLRGGPNLGQDPSPNYAQWDGWGALGQITTAKMEVARLNSSSGWWFGCHFLFSHILGISSSQLTFIFFRGVAQPPTRS